MIKSGLLASGSLLATALLSITCSASAQFVDEGATCGIPNPDPNGGCNATPSVFQDLGSFNVGQSFDVTGHLGTFIPAGGTTFTSRDLDWFKITLTAEAKVTITLNRDDGGTVVLFVGNPATCPATPFFGQEIPSFTAEEFFLTAGDYYVIATTPFEPDAANPIHDCVGYQLLVDVAAGEATCGTGSAQPCDVAHASAGCDDWSCCNAVCAIDPHCCSSQWDNSCVTGGAVAICGYFIYTCPAGGPSNDCLTAPQTITVGSTVSFNTTTANTDGPGPIVTGAPTLMGKDLWYVVQAPSNGQLTIDSCAGTAFDGMIELYGLGTNPVPNPDNLAGQFIGQVDDTCGTTGGPAIVTLIDAVAGEWYLIRVGGFDTDGLPGTQNDIANGPGSFDVSFQGVVYTTGIQKFIVTAAGVNQNLGLSSGALSAAQPRRWYAKPFTVPTPTSGGNAWAVTQIVAKGFTPAGATNTDLAWIIWDRTGFQKPVDGDQVASGSVPFPVPFDEALDSAATASHPIDLSPAVVLEPGDYYLSVYGSNPTDFAHGGTTVSNFAWFIYSPDGINMIDPAIAAGVFGWRSSDFPTPGFVVYQGLTGNSVQAGDDQNDIYNTAFNIFGNPTTVASACTGDLNNSGAVDASDLAILLGAWGGNAGDLNGSGSTDAADLAILLGAWGACP